MPTFKRDDVSIYYEEYGSGFPILLFAPGGMRSAIEFWHQSPFDPTVELANDFRVIAMDQRNAGQSHGPVTAADGWDTYTGDHLALLDHLGIKRTHAMGGCIGGSYSLNLIKLAPDRVAAAVLQNPIGLHNNREAFYEMFDGWGKSLQRKRPELTNDALAEFRERMYGTNFTFNVDQAFVRQCTTPLLILAGDDLYHPAPTSREIAELAPNAEIIVDWKRPEVIPATVSHVRTFLKSHQ
jgi:pimeloyl-ACP methyl ester carboxylesterase